MANSVWGDTGVISVNSVGAIQNAMLKLEASMSGTTTQESHVIQVGSGTAVGYIRRT